MGEAHVVGGGRADRVGAKTPRADGKTDEVFSLSLSPGPKTPKISSMEIRATAGPGGRWNTVGAMRGASFMGIADAKRPTTILNKGGRGLKLDPLKHSHLLLYVNDDGKFRDPERKLELRVFHVNGSSWSVPVQAATPDRERASPVQDPDAPVRMSALVEGISNYDAVGLSKQIKSDDKADGLFLLTVEAVKKEIVAIRISTMRGGGPVWDTVPGTGNGAIGVALSSKPAKLLNSRDGTIRIGVENRVDLNLYVGDDGSIAAGKTKYRVSVTFSDGQIAWCPVEKPSPIATKKEGAPAEPAVKDASNPAELSVNFLATWLGFAPTDAVGKQPGLRPDNTADAVFGLEIEVQPKGVITGVEIQSLVDPGRRWSTGHVASNAWGLAVAYQDAPKTLLNRPEGGLNIPIEGRRRFYVYGADPGDLPVTSQTLRMIVHFSDGQSFQQLLQRPSGPSSTAAPGTQDHTRAAGLITCEFRGFVSDLVNSSARPGKDGYLDGTFIAKIKIRDKTIARIDLKGPAGKVRWSSHPTTKQSLLGVAPYPKIYSLAKVGKKSLDVQVSGHRTLYLYAADNGLLSDPNSRLTLTVTFTDNSQLSTMVIK